MSNKAEEVMRKTPAEVRIFPMNFTGKMTDDETVIMSPAPVVTITPNDLNLVLVSTAANGKFLELKLQGGDIVQRLYTINAKATSSKGQLLEGCGDVIVEPC